jgi:hypothetical protein
MIEDIMHTKSDSGSHDRLASVRILVRNRCQVIDILRIKAGPTPRLSVW